MSSARVRLIGLALVVFVFVPYLVLRQMDRAERADESVEGKTVVVHYMGVPAVARTVGQQIEQAVYQRFLDKPENSGAALLVAADVADWPALCDQLARRGGEPGPSPERRIWRMLDEPTRQAVASAAVEKRLGPQAQAQLLAALNGLLARRDFYDPDELGQVPRTALASTFLARWPNELTDKEVARLNRELLDAALAPRVAPNRNDDVLIESFSGLQINDLPAAWDAMVQMAFAAGRAPDVLQLVTENIQTHREEEFVRPFPDRFTFVYSNAAYDDDSGYGRAAIERFRALRREQEARFQAAAGRAARENLPDADWLGEAAFDFDAGLMAEVARMAPDAIGGADPHLAELLATWNELRPEPRAKGAWNGWLFAKLQAKLPADLLRSLFDLSTGKLYGVAEGEPGLIGLGYRIKPFREAGLTDEAGRPVLPQTWDELEYWSIAVSLVGRGTATDGLIGYKLAHGTLMPFPFPLYAYGAGGRMVTQDAAGRWSCTLDSPGTIRAMRWIGHMAFLKPVKIDYAAAPPEPAAEAAGHAAGSENASRGTVTYPLVALYDRKGPFSTVPQFFLRLAGPGGQTIIRRLILTDDWRVLDAGRELFRFAGRQDLIDRIDTQLAARSAGQCSPTRAMDKNDLALAEQLWANDRLAMQYTTASTLVVDNPSAEGRTRHPDGPAWDVQVAEADLATPAARADLQRRLEAVGLRCDLAGGKSADALIAEFARVGLPVQSVGGRLVPARPTWARPADPDREGGGRWVWVHLVSPDAGTIVTVQRRYVVSRPEWPAWPAGPRFTRPPTAVEGGRYLQFACGLQVPADDAARTPVATYRIQTAVINMGMLALNHRLNESTPADRRRLEAATRLIGFLSGPEAEKIRVDKTVENGLGRTLSPVLLRKYGHDAIADSIGADYEQAMRQISRVGRAVPAVPNYRGFQQFLANLGDRVVIEGQAPADACREVAATANKRFLAEPDPAVMGQRRRVAWAVFAVALALLAGSAAWMGRQIVRGATGASADADLGSVGQRPTWRTHAAAWVFLAPAVLTILVWSYLPLGWGSVMAFQDFHIVRDTAWVGLDNFIRIFTDPEFYGVLANTFYYVALSLGLGFAAPILLALLLHEAPRGKIFFRTVFYLPAITSGLVVLFMWKRFYQPDRFGLLNTLLTSLNSLPPAAVSAVKAAAALAVAAALVALFRLPLSDLVESRAGRLVAAAVPIAAAAWLGWHAPGALPRSWVYPTPDTIDGWPSLLSAGGAACLVALSAAVLAAARRSEPEFAGRRMPWAAPALAAALAAGWLAHQAARPGAAAPPETFVAHVAQLAMLALPLLGAWPILRRLVGREHVPRESMYAVLRKDAPADAAGRLRAQVPRRLCLAAGLLVLLAAAAMLPFEHSPWRVAFKYLLGAEAGWLRRPFVIEPLMWLKDRRLAMLCIILPGIWAHMGPGCLIYLAALKSIPEEVYEAADLDGAGPTAKAWHITVPHLLALIIINFVGAFIGAFQASQNVLVMTAGGPADATMVLGLRVWLDAFVLLKFGYATALAWILGVMLIGFTMYKIGILKKVQFKTAGP